MYTVTCLVVTLCLRYIYKITRREVFMLKKLVKYGNSTALVLEKPILELMGMEEGAFVKISTDGKSLIIAAVPHSKSMINIKEANQVAIKNMVEAELEKKYGKDGVTSEQIEAYQTQVEAMKPVFSELFQKYNAYNLSAKMIANDDYNKEMANAAVEYNPSAFPEEYKKKVFEIRYKYCPELKAYDDAVEKEMVKFRSEL